MTNVPMPKLDDDIPMPKDHFGGKRSQYPFEDMKVGQSFFMAGKTPEQMGNAAGHYRKKFGWKFTTARVEEGGVQGTRIWRRE